jgi:ribosome maturation factor RimP
MKSMAEISECLDPILQEHGLFLVEVKVSTSNVIEIFIDSMQGVNVRTCITVSRALEAKLDRESEDFTLTVCSAGIGFPFKVPQQYEKNVGKEVVVKGTDGKKTRGMLLAYTGSEITIAYEESVPVEGKKKKKEMVRVEKMFPLAEVKEVRDVVKI